MASQLFKKKAFNAWAVALANNIKKLNLKPVKSVELTFDPFSEGAKGVRELSYAISNPKRRITNPDCVVRTKVVCDRSEPSILVKLENGREILYKATNLTSLEILEHLNQTIKPLLKPPEQS